jgi:hypothetical protein
VSKDRSKRSFVLHNYWFNGNRLGVGLHANHRTLVSIAIVLMVNGGYADAQTQQEHVHHMSHDAMPFDMAKTLHIFTMTELGGVQKVIAKDPSEVDQIALIRQHLSHEADRFHEGDYSDPATLHGAEMPGLKEIQLGSQQIKVSFSALSDGAEIAFETTDLHLLTAIHRWFGAQLSEHGVDARAE